MSGTRDILRRIKAVKNTGKITKAMQLVAASKMQRAQNTARKGRAYSLMLAEILESLITNADSIEHPLLNKRTVKNRGILVVSTDKGLCGSLNANLFRMIIEQVKDSASYVTVGRKAKLFISRTKRDLLADFPVSDHVEFAEIRAAVEFMLKAYLEGKIDTIEVIFPRFINTLIQTPTIEKLVPLTDLHEEVAALRKRFGEETIKPTQPDSGAMIFEPNAESMLQLLPDMFLKQEIYQMVLEAKASQHSARMVAMKSATDNAKNLVDDLSLQYNKARQAAITQEILEIAAASAA